MWPHMTGSDPKVTSFDWKSPASDCRRPIRQVLGTSQAWSRTAENFAGGEGGACLSSCMITWSSRHSCHMHPCFTPAHSVCLSWSTVWLPAERRWTLLLLDSIRCMTHVSIWVVNVSMLLCMAVHQWYSSPTVCCCRERTAHWKSMFWISVHLLCYVVVMCATNTPAQCVAEKKRLREESVQNQLRLGRFQTQRYKVESNRMLSAKWLTTYSYSHWQLVRYHVFMWNIWHCVGFEIAHLSAYTHHSWLYTLTSVLFRVQ